MVPAWREIHRRTGQRVQVVVSETYAPTLEGVSFVDAHPINAHWSQDVPKARAWAEARWGHCIVLQWWNDDQPVPLAFRGTLPLDCRGRQCRINAVKWPSYGHSMWWLAGFHDPQDMIELGLVFDRRDPEREAALLDRVWPPALRRKPMLAYNFTGKSSPFGHLPELWPVLQSFARDFALVDLGKIRAARIYDFVGIMEQAIGMLHIDSAPLHLASAVWTPYVAFTRDGWCGSVPKSNCVLRVAYSDTPRRLQEVRSVLEQWCAANRRTSTMLVPQTA